MIVSMKSIGKEACMTTFNITSIGEKYILVNHYDTIIAKGHIDASDTLQSIVIYSSIANASDLKAINKAFIRYCELKKLKGVFNVRKRGQDKWEKVTIDANLDVFHIND